MNRTLTAAALIASASLVASTQAAPFYSESFDYGGSDIGINSNTVGSWTSTSGVLKYDADGGLDVPQLEGETGGSMWLDFTDARSASDASLNYNLSDLSVGESIWMAAIFQYVAGTGTEQILQAQGGSVTGIGFNITSDGDVTVFGSDNGGASNTTHDTGIDATTGTYLLVLRATKGGTNDASGPINSVIDFWFDPTDASSVSALGAADFTTGADSKFGRDGQSLTTLFAQPSEQGRIDEIRIGTDFADLGTVPEPGSLALLGLGGILVASRRRRG